ncbi:MAG: peptidase T, partial [Ignavibacteriales bacterium UTCHB3]
MFNPDYKFTVVDRFLKYVKIDTQSDDEAPEFPTTQKQLDLSRILVEELLELGLKDAHLDEHGYVYATLPSNSSKEVPVVGFIAHVDTSPAVSGKDVKPIIHKNYEGGDIVLPGDTSKVIDVESNPELKGMIGYDIITT